MKNSLSVIIPTYNRALLLKRLLEQLVAQKDAMGEIVVVDDHSQDETKQVVAAAQQRWDKIRYVLNHGKHLAAARQTGLRVASGEYLGFIDDDVIIAEPLFFKKLQPHLRPQRLVQPKVIMENLNQRNEESLGWQDLRNGLPFPIVELFTSQLHRGTQMRRVFPFNELGVFWHHSLNALWHDENLIGDAYGQSFSTALRLKEQGGYILFCPDLLLRHPGAEYGGSKKFAKKLLTQDFTPFHYDYFYNMIYLQSRWFRRWVWLWLPYYVLKTFVALGLNKNVRGWRNFGVQAIMKSFHKNYFRRDFKT